MSNSDHIDAPMRAQDEADARLPTDSELLRRYAEEKSEPAFTELVQRHLDLVYSAAWRQLGGDAHGARDVAQVVFTAVARKAATLARHPAFAGWLYTATQHAAAKAKRTAIRRQVREHHAHAMHALPDHDSADHQAAAEWGHIRPILDEVMRELSERDREAVVLRYFARQPFAEIGAMLRLSEDAARMRVDRAIEKLRALLARRGVTSTAAALAAALTKGTVLAAPAGLARSVAAAAIDAHAASSATFATLMTTHFLTAAAFTAVVSFGFGAYVGANHMLSEPLSPLPPPPAQSQLIASLREQNGRLRTQVDQLNATNSRLVAEHVAPAAVAPKPVAASGPTPEQIRQASVHKAIVNNLRQINTAVDKYTLSFGRPPASLGDLVGEGKYIRALVAVNGEVYAQLSLVSGQPMVVTTADGVIITYDPASAAQAPTPEQMRARQVQEPMNRALASYAAAHGGGTPSSPEALLPYFATPQEAADFVEALEAQKAAHAARPGR